MPPNRPWILKKWLLPLDLDENFYGDQDFDLEDFDAEGFDIGGGTPDAGSFEEEKL